MKTQRFSVALTLINLVVLLVVLFLICSSSKPKVNTVIRGRAFELIDEQGRVRAEIKVLPAEPDFKMPDGSKGSPETVILRLIDSNGGPNVKLTATGDGSGLVLGGDAGYVQVLLRSNNPLIRLHSRDGKE